ncbi:hypothetical protein [Saccharothrix luteola]|uniref:hypothetical protein n=1 Tax=Saccharothrix luteola TaxID=2893018 RepID=UPI001E49D7F3|nr:hypothetical protein [Saccharothrix luteola]MCC8250149.1 hypothetical protein [Saccharothrix luteola]
MTSWVSTMTSTPTRAPGRWRSSDRLARPVVRLVEGADRQQRVGAQPGRQDEGGHRVGDAGEQERPGQVG